MSKAARTRERLVGAFVSLLVEMPYEQITVLDITGRCNMARQSFYYHFHSIHDLAVWECHRRMTEALASAGTYGVDRVAVILDTLYEERRLVLGIMTSSARVKFEELIKDELRLMAMRLAEGMLGDSDLPVADRALLARFYAAGTMEIIEAWIDDGMRESPERLARRLYAVYMYGVPRWTGTFGPADAQEAG